MKKKPIIIFCYSFPHRKTYDFVSTLVSKDYKNLWLVAAPKLKLKHNRNNTGSDNPNLSEKYNIKKLCEEFSLNFIESAHDDKEKIQKIINDSGSTKAIISGARIIKKEIIEMFSDGIINFHPGKIPETSGLDSFFYTIKTNSPMGVTVHLIDHRVDAGFFIFFERLMVEESDTFESIKEKLYQTQLVSLSKYTDNFLEAYKEFPPIDRPKKNIPLTETEKENIRLSFPEWRNNQIVNQKDIES